MKLVADANVLLSAVLGGRARLALTHPELEELFTPEVTMREVEEYAQVLSRKRRLPLDTMLLAVATLPVSIVDQTVYQRSMSQARKLIEHRDPDDVDVLALTLHLKLPLWTNDKDFVEAGITRYSTAELLRRLGIIGRR